MNVIRIRLIDDGWFMLMYSVDVKDHDKSLCLYMYHSWRDVELRTSVEEDRKTGRVLYLHC